MPDLKSCPFCGGKELSMRGWADQYWVECSGCETEGPSGETKTEATEAWNRRYEEPKEIEFDYEAEDG